MKFTSALTAATTLAAIGALSTAIAAADADAGPTTYSMGTQGTVGNQGWTISDLKPSSDTIGYTPRGKLWEATATDEALQGGATPLIFNLNARAADGQNYPSLFGVATPQGVNPAGLAQGQKTTGKVYFDVTGEQPNSVVYRASDKDLLQWVPAQAVGSDGGSGGLAPSAHSTTGAPSGNSSKAAPAGNQETTPPTVGTQGAAPAGSQGTPLPAGSQGTPLASGTPGTAAAGAPESAPAASAPEAAPTAGAPEAPATAGSQGTPLAAGSPEAPAPASSPEAPAPAAGPEAPAPATGQPAGSQPASVPASAPEAPAPAGAEAPAPSAGQPAGSAQSPAPVSGGTVAPAGHTTP